MDREDRRQAYEVYVTDRLRSITGAEIRYADVVYHINQEEPDADEIKNRLKNKLSASNGE